MQTCDKLSCLCIPDTDAGTSRSRILPMCPGKTSLSVRMGLKKVVWHTDPETKKETERLTETQQVCVSRSGLAYQAAEMSWDT